MNELNPAAGHILIVDDNQTNRLTLSFTLKREGYTSTMAQNGIEALETMRAEPFDLILLDIMMPDMDGYQVLEQMKSDSTLQNLPVIVISAVDEMESIVRCVAMGAEDYLPKPFDPVLLRARIGASLEKKRLRDQIERRNRDLEDINASLVASNRELDAFAHTVAHDLKNPLLTIKLANDLLMKYFAEQKSDENLELVQMIRRAEQKSVSIIEELLLLAGVRKEVVQLEPLQMGEIVARAQQRLTLLIEKHQGQIILPAVWPDAVGYAPWVEEVWVNYLSNGLKYGGQSPQLELGANIHKDGIIRFWVRDNGPGLTPEAQAKLFTEFTRLNKVQAEGHGLGLSIVRRIVEKLGGQVGVDSQVGQGSLFYFSLPAKLVDGPVEEEDFSKVRGSLS
jgi:signal transduction histidine kinase